MTIKGSVRSKNLSNYQLCLQLRKSGLSYSEIRRQVPVPKSTLHDWFKSAGLTLTQEHLDIQARKKLENWQMGVEAAKTTKIRRSQKHVDEFISKFKSVFNEPLFLAGVILYQAEGAKIGSFKFSNSDERLINLFLQFAEKYLESDRKDNIVFRLYIHETRKTDLESVTSYWAKSLKIPIESILISWKKNEVQTRRANKNYVGQILVSVNKRKLLVRKILTSSAIIMGQWGIV